MEYAKICLCAILPMAIIFFIINNIIPSKNYARRALILFFVMIGFCLIFAGGMIYDYYHFGSRAFGHYEYYLAVGTIVLLFVGFITYNIIQAHRTHQHITKGDKKYDKDISQFLYIIYRYGRMYYIKKEKSGNRDLYAGECIPFDKKTFFYDDAFNNHISRKGIEVKDYSFIGTATSNAKKKMVFYCFMVDVSDPVGLENLEQVSPYEIATLDMLDLNKVLVMRILIGEQFNIEL